MNTNTSAAAASAETSTKQQHRETTFENWDDDNLEISSKILRGIYAYGYDQPSPIQKKSIIPLTSGNDIIAQAQSGTGKTGAFTVGALNIIDPKLNATQVIILSPTRELALQNKNVFDGIGTFCNFRTHLMVGGTSLEDEKKNLTGKDVPHAVIACPGRLYDMLRRDWLKPDNVRLFILDEADEMLSDCFKQQIYHILQFTPSSLQVALFSATMPEEVKELANKFMRDPVRIFVDADMLTLEGIKQYYVAIEDDEQKYMTLKNIYNNVSFSQTIIYCNSVKRVQDLTQGMNQDNFPVICIHSNMTQEERYDAIDGFKSGKYRVLVSSDITSRGIDVQQVSVVINFDVPRNKHKYLHRIGRSGRWGRKGFAINFVTKRDLPNMKEIEEWYQTQIEELPMNYSDVIKTM